MNTTGMSLMKLRRVLASKVPDDAQRDRGAPGVDQVRAGGGISSRKPGMLAGVAG